MSDVWLAEVSADGIAVVGHTPNPVFDSYATLAARLLVAHDGTDAGPAFPFDDVHSLAIIAGLEDNFFGGVYEWQAYYVFVQRAFPGDPFNVWVEIQQPDTIPGPTSWTPTRMRQANGNNGASYFGGGTLSIQKDYAAGHYIFTTPLGALTVPFDWLDNQPPISFPSWTPSDTPLFAAGIGVALAYADDTVTNSGRVDWYNFYTRQNGTIVAGAALSAADPGTWDAAFTAPWAAPPGGGNYHLTSVLMPSSSSQQLTRYRSLFTLPPFSVSGQDYDATDEQRYTMPAVSGFFGLDIAAMPEHDAVFGVWQRTPNELMVRRTHDHGASWTERMVSAGGMVISPSIQCYAGQVWVCYYTGIAIVTRRSLDLGLTWSSAVPVSITGTNPRLVIGPDGVFFYFYMDAGNLNVQRSFDLGATLAGPGPIVVALSVAVQDIGAVWAADRSLVVAYIVAGNWITKRSLDLGLTWALA